MGRAGTKAGGIFAQNIQAGSAVIATTTGAGSTVVKFPKAMKSAPTVTATIAEADITGNVTIGAVTNVGFTIVVAGSAVAAGDLSVNYIAFDDSYN